MARGRRILATSAIDFRMRTPQEMLDLLFARIKAKNITTLAQWNAWLNDTAEFDEGEKRIIKWLVAVEAVPPVTP